jgi:hypothetical protein
MTNRIFNRRNKYGKYLVEAIVPGWDGEFDNSSTTVDGIIRSYGSRSLSFTGNLRTAPSSGIARNKAMQYQFGQSVKVLEIANEGGETGVRFQDLAGDEGPIAAGTEPFTVVSIVKLIGDGSMSASSDPRIYSKDIGTAEGDHDLMIGFARASGEILPRTRIRGATGTRTAMAPSVSGWDVTDDGWHLVAGTMTEGGVGVAVDVRVKAVYPDGRAGDWGGVSISGPYTPRTTTTEGLFGTAGTSQATNLLAGSILCVYFFEGIELSLDDLRSLYRNPFQVFRQQRLLVPLTAPTPEEPAAADTIASGTPSLDELTSVGVASQILKPSGTPSLDQLTASGTASATSAVLTASGTPDLTQLTASGTAARFTVQITDVNTTETWDDGDTGIPITGTGFL